MNHIKINRGSSMIEVLIAFLILALGITSLVSFQARLTSDSSFAKARSDATNFASSKLEELRNYKSLTEYDAISDDSDSVDGTTQTYTRTWTVTNGPNAKTINLAVTWPDGTGSPSIDTTVMLNTVIARIDPVQTVIAVGSTSTTTLTSTTWTTTTSTTTTTTTTTVTTTTNRPGVGHGRS